MRGSDSSPLSRRRLLQVGGAAGLGLALGGLASGARPVRASTMSFGVGPFDRALDRLTDNGYQLRSAALALNDGGGVLVDGTEQTRRVLYRFADQVGPYMDHLGDFAQARAAGWDFPYDGLVRVQRDLEVYTAPVALPRFVGLRRVFRAGERFGFGVMPNGFYNPGWGRFWPAPGDFWGLAYAIGPRDVPVVWLIASTAEFRAFGPVGAPGPAGAARAVRTEVVAYRGGNADWHGYQAQDAVLCTCLRRGSEEYFTFPNYF
jgi:hypothetical protein